MTELSYKQKTIVVNKFEIQSVINYLKLNYGIANDGIFDMKEMGKIKIKPNGSNVEIMCDCDKNIVNELEEIIEQNE